MNAIGCKIDFCHVKEGARQDRIYMSTDKSYFYLAMSYL